MSERTCSDCLHWRPTSGPLGECRRYAPRPVIGYIHDRPLLWPLTLAAHWCGDFQPRPVAQRQEGTP